MVFSAENIVQTAKKIGVKVDLVCDRFWVDPVLMRITVADPVTVMMIDWLRGYPDLMLKNLGTSFGLWSNFWFGDDSFHIGIRRGLFNLEHYHGKVNVCRSPNPDAYDLGFKVRLDLIRLGIIEENVCPSKLIKG